MITGETYVESPQDDKVCNDALAKSVGRSKVAVGVTRCVWSQIQPIMNAACAPNIQNSPAQTYCAVIWEIASSNSEGLSVTDGFALDCVADTALFVVTLMPNNDIVYLGQPGRQEPKP